MIESRSKHSICRIKQRLQPLKMPEINFRTGDQSRRASRSSRYRAHDLAIHPSRGETRRTSTGRDFLRNSRLKFLLAAVLRSRPRIPFTDWIWHHLFITAGRTRERERERARARAAVINTDFPSVCRCIWKFSTGLSPPPRRLDLSSLPLYRTRTSMLDRRTINKKTDHHPRNSLRTCNARLARGKERGDEFGSVFSSR